MSELFKFCSGDGAISILKTDSIFVTSPLDLNDPFEMRPAWTDDHLRRAKQDEQLRNNLIAGLPIPTSHPDVSVDSQRGLADMYNAAVFRELHSRFRVLSFVRDLWDAEENAILMWTHYADQFQGVCLVLDSNCFSNGIRQGGFEVQYPPIRHGLPPEQYDVWHGVLDHRNKAGYNLDAATGLHLTEKDRREIELERYLKILTHKSPVWKYEREIRMVYSLPELKSSSDYKRAEFACLDCQRKGLQANQCRNASYRDAIVLSPAAVKAVIFGIDCTIQTVKSVLEVLSDKRFSNVLLYWSDLHSFRYSVQYVKSAPTPYDGKMREYVDFIQELRAGQIAEVKGHGFHDGNNVVLRASRKGTNYLHIRPPNDDKHAR